MVNTNVNCRSCMLIRNIWCWTLDSKVEVSTSIYGGIGTPLVTQQPTWWFKLHLSRKAHVSRAMLISELECWWTWFNVELSLIKLKAKVLTIALRTTKLSCKVECCDLLWFLAGLVSLVNHQLTWWFKVHLSRKAHVSRAMLISKLECWWTKFNVELSLIKLKSKV